MAARDPLIPKHGGYRNLKSFRIAQLVYDVTFRFCERYVDRRSRTHDQMVQAARSGAQNIAEGSQVSGTSKSSEMYLTGIARGSLQELREDYKTFLRQRDLPEWPPNHPALLRFKSRRCASVDDFADWVRSEREMMLKTGEPVVPSSVLAANGALSLINLGHYLLSRQLESQGDTFERNGGFRERLYRRRKQARGDESG